MVGRIRPGRTVTELKIAVLADNNKNVRQKRPQLLYKHTALWKKIN